MPEENTETARIKKLDSIIVHLVLLCPRKEADLFAFFFLAHSKNLKETKTKKKLMGREKFFSCFPVFFLLLGVSASTSISDDVFHSFTSTGRNLLQAKKACPVNFEFLNYTIITSQCKGPQYPPDKCCSAFKEFACPYVEQINDLTTDCASTMFSYINLYGKYPPGLFASECREGKEGLACPALPPSTSENASGSQLICNPSLLLMATAGFLVFLFMLL